LYKNAFALAYMTLFGPDNLPPLEAFALGCPVLASDISGAREQLGNAALFVNPTNPQEIAEAILKLHHDAQLRSTLKERGIQRARQWTNKDFLNGIFGVLNEFENIRRCWGSL
jgi:glycosyltransferase involved in cell wall biosynthesis